MSNLSFEKGLKFETYISSLFNKEFFKINEWQQSIELSKEQYYQKMSNPDLTMQFQRIGSYNFAVECKWRQQFYDGKIWWENKEKQVSRYMEFQSGFSGPVFVAFGMGGTPENPDKLFVVPLKIVAEMPDIEASFLEHYERRATQRFFYNTKDNLLS